MITKYILLLILWCCTSCQLTEHPIAKDRPHIYRQDDTSFYFRDFPTLSRADSFELVRIGKDLKYFNGANLSNAPTDEVRFLYDRSFDAPYLISIKDNGTVTVATVDKQAYFNAFEIRSDKSQFSEKEKNIMRYTGQADYYEYQSKFDSAAWIKKHYPQYIDSLYDLHLRLTQGYFLTDSIPIITTTLHNKVGTFNRIVAGLQEIDFWNMPIYEESGNMDGSSWTLEAKIANRHHITYQGRMSNHAYEDICKELLIFSNIPEKKMY